MSRSGYSDDHDNWELIKWRGRIASASRGKRGQRLFRELLCSLDAMNEKRLIADDLVTDTGECCAIGSVLLSRETPCARDLHGDNEAIADEVDVAECLVQEIEYMNDEHWRPETPEQRWERMRAWVAGQIKEAK